MRIFYLVNDVYRGTIDPVVFANRFIRGRAQDYLARQRKRRRRAVGGIKVHYQHCLALRAAGFEAYPLVFGNFDGNVFGFDLEALNIRDVGFDLDADDIVVSTEFDLYDGLQFKNCRRIVFAQNWINIQRRRKPEDRWSSYRAMGFDDVMVCSQYIADAIAMIDNEPAHVITNGIDPDIFYPDPTVRQPNRILCLPRKNAGDLAAIRNMVLKKVSNVEFVEIDGVPEREIADAYRRADIFLATGYPEGFGLPPLEAMFSGCAVVGFAGRGGREFMIHDQTALVAEDGDTVMAARYLVDLVQDAARKEALRAGGAAMREVYTIERMNKAVVDYFTALTNRPPAQ